MSVDNHTDVDSRRLLPEETAQPYTDPYDDEDLYEGETGEGESDEASLDPKTPLEIEEAFFKRQDRTLHQKVDFLLPQLVTMMEERQFLDISPKYQRRFRWKRKKQSLLIESLLLNVPMPSVFLYEIDLAKYEVMDGRQRLSTISDFFKGSFRLSGLTELPYLNGKSWKDLPPKIQATLRRASLPVTIILTESRKNDAAAVSLRQLVFERLNTGGQTLNPQEVRNCIYDGHFNDMLVRVARSDLFTSVWNIPKKEMNEAKEPSDHLKRNRLFATMEDCAIVLRYFAFMQVDLYSQPKKTLDTFMQSKRMCTEHEANAYEQDYLESLLLASNIFADKTFRIYPHVQNPKNSNLGGLLSIPLSDAVLIACKKHRERSEKLLASKDEVVSQVISLMVDRTNYDALIGSKNTRQDFLKRMNLIANIFAGVE